MTRTDILDELSKLPADERLSIVETTLHQLREQLRAGRLDAAAERRERLSVAADALKTVYETDRELTAFMTLDRDDYHAGIRQP
jgi:hypothetical protein